MDSELTQITSGVLERQSTLALALYFTLVSQPCLLTHLDIDVSKFDRYASDGAATMPPARDDRIYRRDDAE